MEAVLAPQTATDPLEETGGLENEVVVNGLPPIASNGEKELCDTIENEVVFPETNNGFIPAAARAPPKPPNPGQIPSPLSHEEEDIKNKLFSPGCPGVQYLRIHCTACNIHLGSSIKDRTNRCVHPLLRVIICKKCYDFYTSGDFDKDDDGFELYCRWCGQGGNVMCCTKCCYVFCQKCVRQNKGRRALNRIRNSEDWECFACRPEEIIRHKVTCTALYEYTQETLKRTDLTVDYLDTDFSICCEKKVLNDKKRAYPFGLMSDEPLPPKPKKQAPVKTYSPKPKESAVINNWKSEEEQDEVVCTPDVLAWMEDEEELPPKPPEPEELPPPRPLIRVKTFAKENMMDQPQVLHRPPMPPLTFRMPQFRFAPNNMRPPQPVFVTPHISQPMPPFQMALPQNTMRFVPITVQTGQAWFNKAAEQATMINGKLNAKLGELTHDHKTAVNIEQMAAVHNKLQELLSSTVNALIQVRKNLRTDFLQDLQKSKNTNGQPVNRNTTNFIMVNHGAAPQIRAPPPLVFPTRPVATFPEVSVVKPNSQNPQVRSVPRLKVKSVEELRRTPPECITIMDEPEVPRPTTNILSQILEPRSELIVDEIRVKEKTPPPVAEIPPECDDQTASLIKQALIESKFEIVLTENLKYKLNNVPENEIKNMLSVRVCLETDFGKGTPKSNPKPLYKPFEVDDIVPEDYNSDSEAYDDFNPKVVEATVTNGVEEPSEVCEIFESPVYLAP